MDYYKKIDKSVFYYGITIRKKYIMEEDYEYYL